MKNKKKIIHLIQSLDSGGCENMLLRTLPLLSDFNHTVITLKHEGELAQKFKEKNISVININQKNIFDIFSYKRLFKEIKKEKPDIIITYLFHADFVGRLFLQIFLNCHSRVGGNPIPIIPFLRTTYNHENYKFARLFEKLTKYFVKQYLANSESVKNFYIKNIGISPEKITVIPNGIDIDFYDRIKRDESLRKSFGINTDKIAIICVANLHINKGHKYLLEAFESVYKENRNVKLLLVGDGDEKENLLKQVKNYQSKNNILFLGKRSNVPQLLKISDIFVLPTLFEGMSNAIMEAMASKLAIITTDIDANKNLIKNDYSGLLVPVRNNAVIAKKLLRLLKNNQERKSLGQNAFNDIKNNYPVESVVSEISDLLKSV